jgi:L-ribulokinase
MGIRTGMSDSYVIGIDCGTDSIRALIVDAITGEELTTDVFYYPRWMQGRYLAPEKNQFRHHPLDYLEGLESTIKNCLANVPEHIRRGIKGISVDTTGSTPCLVDREGNPLSLLPEFSDNPNGMFILWKDHTAIQETDEINRAAKTWGGEDYTKYEGGVYSSEWFWSKILHVFRNDDRIREATFSAVELCDWIPAVLTDSTDALSIKRSRCAAGHKAMWHESWDGLPSEEFLEKLDPLLKGLRKNLYRDTYTADNVAGRLCKEWADRLGLNDEIKIGVGSFDAHMGALGAGIKPYSMVKIIGTSTCDIMVIPNEELGDKTVEGICGQVDGSVIPGMVGLEAGQSSFGDVYAWFKDLLLWPTSQSSIKSLFPEGNHKLITEELNTNIISSLENDAKDLPISETGLVAIDWLNGRRTPNANQTLRGAISGINLGTSAPSLFRALVEATAFGARKINDCFESQGIRIKEIIGIGGVSKKSDFVMQTLADVLNRPIKVCNSDQACALGAAMCAATVAGLYDTIEEARDAMNSGFLKEFIPTQTNAAKYDALYERYLAFGKYIEDESVKRSQIA